MQTNHAMSEEVINELRGKSGSIYLICSMIRPGAVWFATRLEHEHYPVNTPLNDGYNFFRTVYAGLDYYIIEIPEADIDVADALARQCNLKLVNGKPYSPGKEEFNLLCAATHCYTLETLDHKNKFREDYRMVRDYVSKMETHLK